MRVRHSLAALLQRSSTGLRVVGDGGPVALRADGTGASSRRHPKTVLATLTVAVAGFLAFAATPAIAVEPTPAYGIGTFATAGEAGEVTSPTHVAVEPGTANLLVADPGAGAVRVFAPEAGASAAPLTSISSPSLVIPFAVAVDQSTGAIYVIDSGAEEIFSFTSDGAAVPTYTQDPTFTSPTQGAGAGHVGSFASAIAVDPVTHDLLVADAGNDRVDRFTAAGAPVAGFLGVVSASGSLVHPVDIAVGLTGSIFVVDVTAQSEPGLEFSLFEFGVTSQVLRFTSAGARDGELIAGSTPSAVGVEPASGDIDVVGDSTYIDESGGRRLYRFDAGGTPIDPTVALKPAPTSGNFGQVGGIASTASGRLYAAYRAAEGGGNNGVGGIGLQAIRPTDLPGIEVDPVSPIGSTTAHLGATIAPGAIDPATAHIEYCLATKPCANFPTADPSGDPANPNPWQRGPDHTGIATTTTIADDATGLQPNSLYELRVFASNAFVSSEPVAGSFTTAVSPPGISEESSADRTETGATLSAKIDPFGLQTRYHFEYGATAAYGQRVPVGSDAIAGSEFGPRTFSQAIIGLAPGTNYHYRLVATNSAGTTQGPDQTLDTPSATAEPPRVYEQVSPVDKGGANVLQHTGEGFQASPDGERVTYFTSSGLGGATPAEAVPTFPLNVGTRAESGWTSRSTDPPQLPSSVNNLTVLTLGVSEDDTKAVVISTKRLAQGATDGDSNVYLRDLVAGTYTTILSAPGEGLYIYTLNGSSFGGVNLFDGGTPSFSHILIQSSDGESFVQGAPPSAVYDFTDGELRIASIDENGTPITADSLMDTENSNISNKDPQHISADGTRIIFSAGTNPEHTVGSTYERVDDTETINVGGLYGGSSRTGRIIFTYGHDLTPDSSPGEENIYRYDMSTRHLELIVRLGAQNEPNVLNYQGRLGVSLDGSTMYFHRLNDERIFVWRNGEIKEVSPLGGNPGGGNAARQISPDGRYFAFETQASMLGHDSSSTACGGGRCSEVYRYDADADSLTCASCPTDGRTPTGEAQMAGPTGEVYHGNPHFPRSVLDDGEVFFDTPDPLSRADSDSTRDVYSYGDGQATLISSGTGDTASEFADATPDGRNVYFTTSDRLVGQDKDNLVDLYDARKGGGIASQDPPPTSECVEEGCRGAVAVPPAPPSGGSELLSGPGDARSLRHPRKHKRRHKHHPRRSKGKHARPHHKKTGTNERASG